MSIESCRDAWVYVGKWTKKEKDHSHEDLFHTVCEFVVPQPLEQKLCTVPHCHARAQEIGLLVHSSNRSGCFGCRWKLVGGLCRHELAVHTQRDAVSCV